MADVDEQVPATLSEILSHGGEFPRHLLPHGGTALAFFSAGFWGWNDVIYLQQAEMTVTCVDTNKDRLFEMAELYPEGWAFYAEDAWGFARAHAGEKWDVVTVDPWSNMIQSGLDDLPLWCSLANDLVVIGSLVDESKWTIPEGWTVFELPRNERVSWLVMERT